VAVAVALVGVIKRVESPGTGPVGVPTGGVSLNFHGQYIVVIFFEDGDAHNYEFIENRRNPRPIQSFQDTLCTFFKVQSTKMETIDTSFKPKSLNHVHRQLNTEVFDQLIVVLMNN
jgi:hypothetical protein